ncbi:hypothetical protein H257_12557 [Aphanomyces astaci]|uniref:Uncharacterized protein n=1 Tax=Aphanomyces astaci TaxID=112090 RepID=W4FY52_APHAT|nr:hypothetical protein H257_12557 [Aphanomyces astaci]ETV72430.1 hypothetical protein H257_12557 [Aphanomyces astaci]|eukprot:XP_009838112.1 hypothetical protein H257_12557 [Aphanomyces astaci]
MRTPRVTSQVDDGRSDSPGRKGAIAPEAKLLRGDDRTVLFPQVGKTVMDPENQVNNAHHPDDVAKAVALDGFLLLDTCRVEFPEEATRADVNGLNIRSVVVDDLLFFSNLVFLDMSDNQSPFEPLGTLPALKELDFQCNAVHKITNLTGFDALEWLNLSFNCLTSPDVEELAKLPKLRELYLSNNAIATLPPIMDRFSRLETLSLERNNIQGMGVFTLLAVAPRLRNLNLSHNKIVEFPESALALHDKQSNCGFVTLAYLNLAHNKISRECDILPLVKMRSLQQLVLYGNPLAHAAVQTQDKTKLLYNPVPDMTDVHIDIVREVELNIVVAYPATKKKKSTYKNVQIARVAQAALPTSFEFKARAQRMLFSPLPQDHQHTTIFPRLEKKDLSDAKPSDVSTPPGPDSTFLTGLRLECSTSALVARQDKFPHVKDRRHMENDVPSYFLARSLAPTTDVQQHKLKTAMTSLRYQLNHPLTSHNDMDVMADCQASRPNAIHKIRQRPKRHDDKVAVGGVLATIDRAIDDVNSKLHHRDLARHRGDGVNAILRKAHRLVQHG